MLQTIEATSIVETQTLPATRAEIARYLPHRGDLVLLDRILDHCVGLHEDTTGSRIDVTGELVITPDLVAGHFDEARYDGCQLLPLHLLFEIGAQLALFAVQYPKPDHQSLAIFKSGGSWNGPLVGVVAGDCLTIQAMVDRFPDRKIRHQSSGVVMLSIFLQKKEIFSTSFHCAFVHQRLLRMGLREANRSRVLAGK